MTQQEAVSEFFEERNVDLLLEENAYLAKKLVEREHELNHLQLKFNILQNRFQKKKELFYY